MQNFNKFAMKLYRVYIAIGIIAIGAIAASVIFTVIMRYLFNISFTFLEELITVLFAFSTFWGIGMCILENEHIVIDIFINKLKPTTRRYVNIFNYSLVLIINCILLVNTISWINTAGKILSNGMHIKYKYIYGVMPIGVTVGIICSVIKIVLLILDKEVQFKPEGEESLGQSGA